MSKLTLSMADNSRGGVIAERRSVDARGKKLCRKVFWSKVISVVVANVGRLQALSRVAKSQDGVELLLAALKLAPRFVGFGFGSFQPWGPGNRLICLLTCVRIGSRVLQR